MSARIRSFRNFVAPIDDASRDDIVLGDVVSVTAIDAATTYAWALVFTPEGSAAGFSGTTTDVSPGQFTADVAGPYLVRLIVDAGLVTESEQYVRIRALTVTTPLYLVAAGERRDTTGVIPVDADAQGWADDQNRNLNSLLALIKPFTFSSNILYVDSNTGTEGRGDYDSIQDAIDVAVADVPSTSNQWYVVVRPGTYNENLTLAAWVHVVADPTLGSTSVLSGATSAVVVVGNHTASPGASTATVVDGVRLQTSANTASPTVLKAGAGTLLLRNCVLSVLGVSVAQGAALEVGAGVVYVTHSTLISTSAGAADRVALLQDDTSTLYVLESEVTGPIAVSLNPDLRPTVISTFRSSSILSYAGEGILTDALVTAISYSDIVTAGSSAILVHPGAAAYPNAVDVRCAFLNTAHDIEYDITGIGGVTSLYLSGCRYASLVLPGGSPAVLTSEFQAFSVFYDNTASGLTSTNVQDAIDEIAAGVLTITTATTNPYNVLTTDNYVLVNVVAAGAVVVNLPAGASHSNAILVIKDRKGDAGGATPISVVANGAETIDGLASYPLTSNYASVTLLFSGTEWSVV